MKKNLFIIIAMFFATSFSVNAQNQPSSSTTPDESKSLIISVVPVGGLSMSMGSDNNTYDYDYSSLFSIGIEKEGTLGKLSSLIHLTYTHASLSKYSHTGKSEKLRPENDQAYYSILFSPMFGKIINPYGRIKFPLYLGLCMGYENSGALHNLTIGLQGKARVKYYISPKIGVFAGGTARFSYGSKKAEKYDAEISKDSSLGVGILQWGIETGVAISLN